MSENIDISKVILKKEGVKFLREAGDISEVLKKEEQIPSFLDNIEITPRGLLSNPELFDFLKKELESKTIKDYFQGLVTEDRKEDIFVIRRRLKEEGVIENKKDSGNILSQLLFHQISDHNDILSPEKRGLKILNIYSIKRLKTLLEKEYKTLENEKLGLQQKLADLKSRIEKISFSLEPRYGNHKNLEKEFYTALSDYQSFQEEFKKKTVEIDVKLKKLEKVLSIGSESIKSFQTMYSQGKKIYVDNNFRRLDQRIVESKQEKYRKLERLYSQAKDEKKEWQEKLNKKEISLANLKSKFKTSEKMIKYFEHVNENCKRTEKKLKEELKSLEEERAKKSGKLDTLEEIIDSYESCRKYLEEAINELAIDINSVEKRMGSLTDAILGLNQLKDTEGTYKETVERANERIKELRFSLDKNCPLIKAFIHKKKRELGDRAILEEDLESSPLIEEYRTLDSSHKRLMEELQKEIEERKKIVSERKTCFERIKEELERGKDEIEGIQRDLIDVGFRLSTNYSILNLSCISREVFSNLFLFIFLKKDFQKFSLQELKSATEDQSLVLKELRPKESLDLKSVDLSFYRKKHDDLAKECTDIKEFLKEEGEEEKEDEKEVVMTDNKEISSQDEEKPKEGIFELNKEVEKLREELYQLSTQNKYFLEELSSIKNMTAGHPVKEKEPVSDLQNNIDLMTTRLQGITREDILSLLTSNEADGSEERIEDLFGCIKNLLGALFEGKKSSHNDTALKEIVENKISEIKELFETSDKKEPIDANPSNENDKLKMKLEDLAGELADSLIQNKQIEEQFSQNLEKKDQEIKELSEKIEKLSLQLLQYKNNQDAKSEGREKNNIIEFGTKKGDINEIKAKQNKAQYHSIKKVISTIIFISGITYYLIHQNSATKFISKKNADLINSHTSQVEMLSDRQVEGKKMLSNLLGNNSLKSHFSVTGNAQDELYLPGLKRIIRVRDFVYAHGKANNIDFLTKAVLRRIKEPADNYNMSPHEFISFMNRVRDTSMPLTTALLKKTEEDIAFLDKEYKGFVNDLRKETNIVDSLILVYELNEIIEHSEIRFFWGMYNEFLDLGIPRKDALTNILQNEKILKEKREGYNPNHKILYRGTIRPIKILEEMNLGEFKLIAVPYIQLKYREFANFKRLRIPRGLNEYAVNMAENIYLSAKKFNIPITSLMTITHQESFFLNILGDNRESASPFQIYRPTKLKILENMRREGFKMPRDIKHLENHLCLAGYMAAYHFAELMEFYAVEFQVSGPENNIKKIVYDLNRSTTSYNGGKSYHKEVFLKQLELKRFMDKRLQAEKILS